MLTVDESEDVAVEQVESEEDGLLLLTGIVGYCFAVGQCEPTHERKHHIYWLVRVAFVFSQECSLDQYIANIG